MKNPIQFLCAAVGALLLSEAALAHPITFNSTMTYSAAQPSGAADSVAQWSGAAFDAENIGGSGVNADGGANNGTANDASTRVVNGQPAQGQTFTTGSNPNGYDVSGVTVRLAGYTNNTASGANQTSWNLGPAPSPIIVTFGKVSGTAYSLLSIQNFMAGGEGTPGSGTSVNGPGTHLTFNLPFPVHLDPNTIYSFELPPKAKATTTSNCWERAPIPTPAARLTSDLGRGRPSRRWPATGCSK